MAMTISYIINFLDEIPLPPLGRLQLRIMVDSMRFLCSRPAPNNIPVIINFPLSVLFTCLSSQNIVRLFECVANERKVVLISTDIGALGFVAEAITAMLFPCR
jgi:hypothetical protein